VAVLDMDSFVGVTIVPSSTDRPARSLDRGRDCGEPRGSPPPPAQAAGLPAGGEAGDTEHDRISRLPRLGVTQPGCAARGGEGRLSTMPRPARVPHLRSASPRTATLVYGRLHHGRTETRPRTWPRRRRATRHDAGPLSLVTETRCGSGAPGRDKARSATTRRRHPEDRVVRATTASPWVTTQRGA
jgi:hypothetical protein